MAGEQGAKECTGVVPLSIVMGSVAWNASVCCSGGYPVCWNVQGLGEYFFAPDTKFCPFAPMGASCADFGCGPSVNFSPNAVSARGGDLDFLEVANQTVATRIAGLEKEQEALKNFVAFKEREAELIG